MDTVALILSIVGTAVGATWVLSNHLTSIQIAMASMVERVSHHDKRLDKHDADIIDIKKARGARRK